MEMLLFEERSLLSTALLNDADLHDNPTIIAKRQFVTLWTCASLYDSHAMTNAKGRRGKGNANSVTSQMLRDVDPEGHRVEALLKERALMAYWAKHVHCR